jgi:hypothetical protein
VLQASRFFLCEDDGAPGPVGEPLKHATTVEH